MFRNLLPALRQRSLEMDAPATMRELMEDFWRSPLEGRLPSVAGGLGLYPALDVSEDETQITVRAELPGLDPKDVDVSLQADRLVIRGEKKFEGEEKRDNYHRIERGYGAFNRSLALPAKVRADGVSARFDKGVLTVTLPKAEPGAARKVEIQT